MARKKGLGRGLEALLSQRKAPDTRTATVDGASSSEPGDTGDVSGTSLVPETTATGAAQEFVSEAGTLRSVKLSDISPGQYQPRRHIDDEALDELAASIKRQGLMQPVVVRPLLAGSSGGPYELIAGERRWRAAERAGLQEIPALVRKVADEDALALALIENIQREDLNPLEEALALQRLQQEFELTQQQIADLVGKSRVAVTNLLRLLNLSALVREFLERGDLEMGHARALLTLAPDQQLALAEEIVEKGLTVRDAEALVRRAQEAVRSKQPKPFPVANDADTQRLERDLGDKLGAAVQIQHSPSGKGKLVIKYGNLDELDGILKHIQ